MSMTCETVKIKADVEGGHIVINAEDFDPAKHEKFDVTKDDEPKRKPRAAKVDSE